MNKVFSIICAYVKNSRGIGFKNRLPWSYIKEDMKHFQKITTKTNCSNKRNAIIMGRKTWESLPKKPLNNRLNVILSNTININRSDVKTYSSFNKALDELSYDDKIESLYVIGGEQIFKETINHVNCSHLILTEVFGDYEVDSYLPELPKWMKLVIETPLEINSLTCNKIHFKYYDNILDLNSDEFHYLNLLKETIMSPLRETRNACTFSKFGGHLVFDMEKGFPLLTTKKMFWRGIVEELLFFIRGNTDSNKLSDKGIKIWNMNTNREFLDSRGLQHYKVGDMGPMYGWNWRYFGAKYNGMNNDYTNQGYDQLSNCIDLIKNDPTSRRIILTTHDPSKVVESVLAPCHSLIIQFYVEDKKLSISMYQRSADIFLGLPFNIASTSLLLHLVAKLTNKKPDKVHIYLGDVHCYEEHVEQVHEQLKRIPYSFPKLKIKKCLDNIKDIESLMYEDILLIDYNSYSKITAKMIS